MIAVATVIVNVKVSQTFEAPLFRIRETPSRGTKIRAVSFDIIASAQIPATIARVFIKSVYTKLNSFNFSASSGRPSDSKLTSIFLDMYCSVNLTGYTTRDLTSSTNVSHLAFFLL